MTVDTTQPAVLNHTDARIGIALGSGSARGWAHIGVLRALAEMEIYPGVVAGCSIGSLVGAAYASDQLDALEGWVNSLSWKDILAYLDLSLLGGGLIQGEKLMKFAREHMGELEIQSLPVSFAAVATELNTGREIWLREGALLDSIRASIALPGLFAPFKLDGRWLMDGGLVDPVPISLCRAMGAEVVIAVNLNGDIVGKHLKQKNREPYSPKKKDLEETDIWIKISNQITNSFDEQKDVFLSRLLGGSRDTPGLFDVMANSINIMQDRITRSRMAGDPAEVMLAPRLSGLGLMEFDQAAIAIDEGYACVERMRPALDQMLSEL
ncbi:MAG: patatin-like phospholipase RssA [Gammaproteobacteria bacterium]|nr:MAG: patatin-like phospholipase RssA [Gammaproteobacteria bacterium]